ncbi:multi-sensor signal transduction histidine kinase [Geitlerinema sp. PCC 7407]|nr:multi-sensor signal transduction histidine kinase [Geitlerinema sp. PCC 7407]
MLLTSPIPMAERRPNAFLAPMQATAVVVTPDTDTQILLRQVLEAEGYRVILCEDTEQCEVLTASLRVTLLVLDIDPGATDWEALCQQNQRSPGSDPMAIVLVSESADDTWLERGFELGAMDCLVKPLRRSLLARQIRRWRADGLVAPSHQERLLRSIAQRVRQGEVLSDLLETTLSELQHLLQVDRLLIFQHYPDGQCAVAAEVTANDVFSVLGRRIADPWFAYHLLRQRSLEPLDLPHPSLKSCADLRPSAQTVLPIYQGKTRWELAICQGESAARPWQASEQAFLEQVCLHLAIALQQAEMQEQMHAFSIAVERQVATRTASLEQALRFEATLSRITDKVRNSLDENLILQKAVEELALVLNIGTCNAALYDLATGTSTICYEAARTIAPSQGRVTSFAVFPDLYGQLLSGQPSQFCYITPNPVRGLVSLLVCPIMDDQEVLGDLWLVRSRDQGYDESEVRLVEQVANHCAIAIRQARLYQALQVTVNELEKRNQLKDDFLSTVSHELRSPMTNMRLAIQMLERSLSQAESTTGRATTAYLKILKEECEQEITLINDLLDLQRLEGGHQGLSAEIVAVEDWLPDVVKSFQARLGERQQTLKFNIDENLPPLVTDASALRRIVMELLHNACKYTPPGEIIAISALVKGDRYCISVCNHGVEIPAKELERIFEKFYRVPNGDRWKQGGSGLGLALVKRLADHLGGVIQVYSHTDETCFTLEMPLNPETNPS